MEMAKLKKVIMMYQMRISTSMVLTKELLIQKEWYDTFRFLRIDSDSLFIIEMITCFPSDSSHCFLIRKAFLFFLPT